MKILPSSDKFIYTGRIADTDTKAPLFIYAGSMAETIFTGSKIGVYIKNQPMGEYYALGAMVDGVQYKIEIPKDSDYDKEIYLGIAEDLTEGDHSLVIFKRQAAAHYFRFCGIETDENAVLSLPAKEYSLNIEVFGDSVSAGELTEGIYHEASTDPVSQKGYGYWDNSWFSYPLILSRMIKARVYDNSQGGIALLNKTGFFCGPDPEKLTGVEVTYNKLSYVPYSKEGYTDWDFTEYTPDLVIIAIGQNDQNPTPENTKTPEFVKAWKEKYKEIVLDLRKKYGEKVKFLFILTVLMHEERWDGYLDDIEKDLAKELGENTVKHYKFSRCGKATPGHPRISEQSEMAAELALVVRDWFNLK